MEIMSREKKLMGETMQVRVRAFASLRQALGASELSLDLPTGATVAQLLERLGGDYPAVTSLLSRTIVAVNQDYTDRSHSLVSGDEIAIFPPVSGGADGTFVTYAALCADPIDPLALAEQVTEPGTGAVVTFAGVVRDNNLGRRVSSLAYEAYSEMAAAKMRQIVDEARQRWPLIRNVAVVHRTGHLEIGETAVLVAVGAPHRDDGAFEAARHIIDRTKEIVPIWKKEIGSDGEEWLEGDYHPQPGE